MRRIALLMLVAAMALLSAAGMKPAEIGRCSGAATITAGHELWWTC